MTVITTTRELEKQCEILRAAKFATVDTEFLREKTYFPKLCLVQTCAENGEPVAIDPLAEGIDLSPLGEFLRDKSVLKVFHAGRQDLEIFFNLFGYVPEPIFDTQVAAMVCGFGDSVGYQKLVQDICGEQLDKSHQFTDWEYRPLSDKQLKYALDDVTYLQDIYKELSRQLDSRGRGKWLNEEMDILTDRQTYECIPEEAWERLKLKNTRPRTLAAAQALAAWRENEAMRKDIPRTWILRDDTLVDLAQRSPKNVKDLKRIRNFPSNREDSNLVKSVLRVLADARDVETQDAPEKIDRPRLDMSDTPTFEMLKMLLRIKAAENEVAARVIATQDELKRLAGEDAPDIKALRGWRLEIFGDDAIAMKQGKIGLSLKDGEIVISSHG